MGEFVERANKGGNMSLDSNGEEGRAAHSQVKK